MVGVNVLFLATAPTLSCAPLPMEKVELPVSLLFKLYDCGATANVAAGNNVELVRSDPDVPSVCVIPALTAAALSEAIVAVPPTVVL